MRQFPILVAAALGGVMAAGCTSPSHTYVADEATGTQYALPAGWQADDLVRLGEDPESPLAVPDGVITEQVFAPGGASLPDGWSPFVDFPFGYTRVRSLSTEEQDEMSIKALRSAVIDIDAARASDPAGVSVLDQQLLASDGYRGEHLLYSWYVTPEDPETPPMTVTVDQTTYLDPFTSREYVFVIACNSDCFLEHSEAIQGIVGSWSVVPA